MPDLLRRRRALEPAQVSPLDEEDVIEQLRGRRKPAAGLHDDRHPLRIGGNPVTPFLPLVVGVREESARTRSSRSRSKPLPDAEDADLPELQPADARLYCLAVAGNDHCELARLDVGGRGFLHRLDRHRLDVRDILPEVVVGQFVDDHLLDVRREVLDRLELAGKSERDVILGLRQFFGVDG